MSILPETLRALLPPFIFSLLLPYLEHCLRVISETLYLQLIRRHPNHLLVQLSQHLDLTPLENACANFHHTSGPGSPPLHPVSRLIRALLIKHLYHFSDRTMEEYLTFHLLFKWFAGYALFDLAPDHVTLSRFEKWVAENQHRAFFDVVLQQIDHDFPEQRALTQIGDTFAMQANAAKESLIQLIRHACQRLLHSLHQVDAQRHESVIQHLDLLALFGDVDEKNLYWLSDEEESRVLQTTVLTALHCAQLVQQQLTLAPPLDPLARQPITTWLTCLQKILADEVEVTPTTPPLTQVVECDQKILADEVEVTPTTPPLTQVVECDQKILADEVEVTPTTPPLTQVVEREKEKKGSFRLGSATDPEATYRVHAAGGSKTDLGYNVSVAVGDPAAETGGFIREIRADTGAYQDASALPALLTEQKKYHELTPPKMIYDRAAGAGKTRAAVAQATHNETQLVAYLPSYAKRTNLFAPDDFLMSADGTQLICPHDQSTPIAYRSQSGDGRTFHFLAFQCQDCPLWERCRKQRRGSKAKRQVFMSDYRDDVLAARIYNQTEAFKQEMKKRPLIERIIAVLVRYQGARRARCLGLYRADFQAKMAGMTYNLKHWMKLLKERRNMPKEISSPLTRVDSVC